MSPILFCHTGKTFQNLLGPLSDILQRDMEKYDNMDAIMMTQQAVQGAK